MRPGNNFLVDTVEVAATGTEELNRMLGVPHKLTLMGGEPNPFVGQTRVVYGLPRAQEFRIAIYRTDGELVQVLASARPAPATTSRNGMEQTAVPARFPAESTSVACRAEGFTDYEDSEVELVRRNSTH